MDVSRVQVSLHEKAPVVRRWRSCHASAVPTQAAVVGDMAGGVYVLCHRPRRIVVSRTSRVERRLAALRAHAILTAVQSHVRIRSSGNQALIPGPSRRVVLALGCNETVLQVRNAVAKQTSPSQGSCQELLHPYERPSEQQGESL